MYSSTINIKYPLTADVLSKLLMKYTLTETAAILHHQFVKHIRHVIKLQNKDHNQRTAKMSTLFFAHIDNINQEYNELYDHSVRLNARLLTEVQTHHCDSSKLRNLRTENEFIKEKNRLKQLKVKQLRSRNKLLASENTQLLLENEKLRAEIALLHANK